MLRQLFRLYITSSGSTRSRTNLSRNLAQFSTGTSGEVAATSDPADLAPVSAEDVEEISPSVDADLSASPAEPADTFRGYAPLPRFATPRKRPTLPVERALQWVKDNATAKFDESVEVHIQMGVDPKRSDQVVRGMAVLPHGTGKKTVVAVFARGKEAELALAAGADVVGAEDLVQKIKSEGTGAINFDRAIGHPSVMPILAPIARVLGPRGLMPNPKLGTLTTDLAEAVKKAKQGQVEFRADRSAIIHAPLGKVSFDTENLEANLQALITQIYAVKPTTLKGNAAGSGYIKCAMLCSSQGKSVAITKDSLLDLLGEN